MITWLITVVFFVAGAILRSVSPENAILNTISNDTLGRIFVWIGVALGIWCLLWLPFKRHEASEEVHAEEKRHLINAHTDEKKKLLNELQQVLDRKAEIAKREEIEREREKLLHDFIFSLRNRIVELKPKRHFGIQEGDVSKTRSVIAEIYEVLKVKIGQDAAAHFVSSTSPHTPLNVGPVFTETEQDWSDHLNYIEAHIESLKTIIEKRLNQSQRT